MKCYFPQTIQVYLCELFGETRETSEQQFNKCFVVGSPMGPDGIENSIIRILEQPYHQQTYDAKPDTSS